MNIRDKLKGELMFFESVFSQKHNPEYKHNERFCYCLNRSPRSLLNVLVKDDSRNIKILFLIIKGMLSHAASRIKTKVIYFVSYLVNYASDFVVSTKLKPKEDGKKQAYDPLLKKPTIFSLEEDYSYVSRQRKEGYIFSF